MTIVWDAFHECWVVVENEVEIGRFSSHWDAEEWVIAESKRREAAT